MLNQQLYLDFVDVLYYNTIGGGSVKRLEKISVTKINDIFIVNSEKGRIYECPRRKYYGLSFCIDGQITYVHNNKHIVSDPGYAIILPQHQQYVLYGDKTGDFPLINFFTDDKFKLDEFIKIKLHNPESYIREYETMRELNMFAHNRLRVMGMFYGMLDRLVHEESGENSALTYALDFIENHYRDAELTNQVLADRVGISEIYLRQLFRKQMGTSPKQYIIGLRIEKAKQLLCESSDSVTDISAECGFSSIYHFCRAFREAVSLTPTEYRSMNRRTM